MNVLVDTSVWINHFHTENRILSKLLQNGQVVTHPLIIGELACGNLRQRLLILALLNDLPTTAEVTVAETLAMVERRKRFGRGIGLVDFMILASTILTPGTMLWTADKGLTREAELAGQSCGPATL